MPSVVSKIKDRIHGRDTYEHDDEYDDSGRLDVTEDGQDQYGERDSLQPPGSFPSTNTSYDEPANHHADGHKYVAPHGTHVGGHGHGHSGRGEVTDSDKLMDPADRGTGSNVLGESSVGADTAGTSLHDTTYRTGSNKLHGRDVPGAYEGGDHSSALPSSGHHGHGQDETGNTTTTTTSIHTPYGQHGTGQTYPDNNLSSSQHHQQHHTNPATSAAGGATLGGLAASQLPDRSRHHDEADRTDRRDYAGNGSDGRGGGGVYNTVVGRGTNDDSRTGSGAGKTGAIPREAGDSRITSGPLAGMDTHDATSGPGRHGFDPSSTHQGPMARDSTATSVGGGAAGGSGLGAVPARLDAHSNARVMHRCSACGHDNDISHYFKKDLVYRIDHQ